MGGVDTPNTTTATAAGNTALDRLPHFTLQLRQPLARLLLATRSGYRGGRGHADNRHRRSDSTVFDASGRLGRGVNAD